MVCPKCGNREINGTGMTGPNGYTDWTCQKCGHGWRQVADEVRSQILRDWCNGEFRAALQDQQRVLASAAMLRVVTQRGDPAWEVIAITIADFVKGVLGIQ